MGTKEQNKIAEILSTIDPETERLFRINSGMGWIGKYRRTKDGIVIIENGRPLHAAPEGWPDLAGWKTIEITPEMIGKKIAVFMGKEIKVTGKLSKAQKIFGEILTQMGGLFEVIS